MKKFNVNVREVHIRSVCVEAKTSQEAIQMAKNQLEEFGSDEDSEFSHTLGKDTWTVEELNS